MHLRIIIYNVLFKMYILKHIYDKDNGNVKFTNPIV